MNTKQFFFYLINIWKKKTFGHMYEEHVAKYGHVYLIRASIWTRVKYTRPIGHVYLKHVSSLLRV
jgi:hypothetical protein